MFFQQEMICTRIFQQPCPYKSMCHSLILSALFQMKTRSKESLTKLGDILKRLKPSEFKDNHLAAYKVTSIVCDWTSVPLVSFCFSCFLKFLSVTVSCSLWLVSVTVSCSLWFLSVTVLFPLVSFCYCLLFCRCLYLGSNNIVSKLTNPQGKSTL